MRLAATWCAVVLFSSVAVAGPAYDDPDKAAQADADFLLQGEYGGVIPTDNGDLKLGVQVIALGEGKFQAVGYVGGLPGDGWDGQTKHRTDGERQGNVVTFQGDKGSGILKDGRIEIYAGDKKLAELMRLERKSETLGQKPPAGAKVLFDGTKASLANWQNGQLGEGGLLLPGITSQETFGDQTLHLEFRTPFQPQERGQARGNSGVYLQGRYEVQMLDSFGLEGEQNECGGLYSVKKPDVNMCYPPLTWQTYDIDYTAAKYEAGKIKSPPSITVRHNGVVIHDKVELPGDRNSTAAPVQPGPENGPIYLQDHGNPMRYRNIWVVTK